MATTKPAMVAVERSRKVHVCEYPEEGATWLRAACGKQGERRELPDSGVVHGGLPICAACCRKSPTARGIRHNAQQHTGNVAALTTRADVEPAAGGRHLRAVR